MPQWIPGGCPGMITGMKSQHLFPATLCLILALLTGAAGGAVGVPPPETPAVRLHPDLPEILERELIARLALFPDVPHLVRVRFGQAPWGAVLARLEVDDPAAGPRVFVRSLSAESWLALQGRAAALLHGTEPPPMPRRPEPPAHDPLATVRSWPETPPPPTAPHRARTAAAATGRAPVSHAWLALVEAGVRQNVSGFNDYFTPMGQVGLSFGYGVTEHFVPQLGFQAGFGDMRGDFEDAFGDGRTNLFGFTLATLGRLPASKSVDLYAEGGVGYYIRSLFWGGTFVDPRTGEVTRGRVVEQKNLGWSGRVGLLLRRNHPSRPRFLDIGVGVQTTPADPWIFANDDGYFEATDRDTWVYLAVRFWDAL